MTKRIKFRTLLMGGAFTLLFVGLIIRVYWVQVANADFWAEQARKTWITSEKIPQERGMLLDRDGKVLAADAAAYTVAVGPKRIAALEKENPEWKLTERITSKLNSILGTPEDKLRDIIQAKKDDGTYREQREVRPDGWKIDKAVKDRLDEFGDELRKLTGKKDVGLYFIEEQKRYYPNGSLASHILGYENKEGKAVIGLERKFDKELSGQEGWIKYQKDGIRTQLPDGEVEVKQAVNGKHITLTIDRDIQYYIEEALRSAYEEYDPVSITAIAADPKTMEILGMASLPDYNPNKYWEAKDQVVFKDNAIESVYEPGSTFKIVTLAAAVQEGIFKPGDLYKSGSIKVTSKSRPIRDHNGRGWGEISYLDGLKHSSNVAFVKLGYEMLGAEKLRSYIDAFGFGQKTGVELPGEQQGAISFRNNIATEVATAAFGQGLVQVTPIQQVQAVAAVANGGKLMQAHLIKSITDPSTGHKQVTEPKVIRQVISEATSRKVGEYLEQVVSDQEIGTGKNAYIPGYRIAGKTGTAQKVISGEKGYSDDKYVVSFVGYAPVEDPKIVLYVIVDEPNIPAAGGGSVAAPIFKKIMGQSLLHLGIAPDLPKVSTAAAAPAKAAEITAEVPDVTGMTVANAREQLRDRGFKVGVLGKGGKVLQQLPKAGNVMPTSQQIYLLTDTKPGNVPDLKGLSLRDALEMCSLLQTPCTVDGSGYVIGQKAVKSNGKWIVQLTLAPPGSPDG